MRISDWSSDVCSSDLDIALTELIRQAGQRLAGTAAGLDRIAEVLETERFDQVIPRAEALRRAHGLDLRSGGDQHGIGVAVLRAQVAQYLQPGAVAQVDVEQKQVHRLALQQFERGRHALALADQLDALEPGQVIDVQAHDHRVRSEEHTSELQSLMRISYAVFCLKKKKHNN